MQTGSNLVPMILIGGSVLVGGVVLALISRRKK